jgi:2'-5' RNA ligase
MKGMDEVFTQKYTLAYVIDALPVGYGFSMQEWPLHVTLADVFAVSCQPDELLERLGETLKRCRPMHARVTGEDWFGEKGDVHVMLLDKGGLQILHEAIVDTLNGCGVVFNNPQFIMDGFKPHSTVKSEAVSLRIGDDVFVDSISLIDMFPEGDPFRRKIIGSIRLDS